MEPDADLAAIGRLIGDPNRARMLQVLMGGTPQSGSALAEAAGISRSLASAHLKKLTAGGLARAERRGRQQLYSLADGQVAEALEILQLLAPAMAAETRLAGSSTVESQTDTESAGEAEAFSQTATASGTVLPASRTSRLRNSPRRCCRASAARSRHAARSAPGVASQSLCAIAAASIAALISAPVASRV